MKKIFLIGVFLCIISNIFAQKVLVLENLSIGKTYKFVAGDVITVKANDSASKVSGKITEILDSSIVISNTYVFDVNEIALVYKTRRSVEVVSLSLMAFGGMFFTLDVVNNVINKESPVVKADVTLIAAAIVGVGAALQLFTKRKCEIRKDKWRLKIIDQIHVKP
jgi:hypothetical protein